MKIAAILLALALPASARIGETLDQCIARYGPKLESPVDGSVAFVKSSCDIIAHFGADGKCDFIQFESFEGIFVHTPKAMDPALRNTILLANGFTEDSKMVNDETGTMIIGPDGLRAFIFLDKTTLRIFGRGGMEWFAKVPKTGDGF